MNRSENINELAAALAKAQSEMTGALKDSANPFFKSKYADLASVWDACRIPLSKNGLAVTQITESAEGGLVLTTLLMHSSGQFVSSSLPVNPVKNDPQGLGSAITYMRRYGLASITGVAQVDDDGHAASGRSLGAHPEQPPKGDGRFVEEYCCSSNLKRPFGALAKKPISEADPVLLRAAVHHIEAHAKTTGKPIPEWAQEFIERAEPFIADHENKKVVSPVTPIGDGNFND